jgi:hypothetical protein
MTQAQTSPDTDPGAFLDPIEAALSETHALRRLAMLERMAEIGMALMSGLQRRVERQLEAEEAGEETPGEALNAGETALTFSRLTRAMRLTFALDARMREELRVREYGPPAGAGDDAPTEAEQYRAAQPMMDAYTKASARTALTAVMTEAIETGTAEPSEVERLKVALYERIYESEDEDDVADLRLDGALDRLCADLGVDPALVARWRSGSWVETAVFCKPVRPPGAADRPARPPYPEGQFYSAPYEPPDG